MQRGVLVCPGHLALPEVVAQSVWSGVVLHVGGRGVLSEVRMAVWLCVGQCWPATRVW